MFELNQHVALITGAARGLGREIALTLAELGCDIAVNFKSGENPTEAHAVVDTIRSMGRRAEAFAADVSVGAEVDELFRRVLDAFGTLRILVNNAGTARPQNILDTSEEDWHSVIDTNLTSCFLCARAALRHMATHRFGTIVNITSVAGERGHLAGQVHYAASKSGMIGLTKTLARTAAPMGVRVNAVAPGLIATELLHQNHPPDELARFAADIPLGIGKPRDVALAVAYLCGEGGRYVTGATLDVNGGAYLR